MDGITKTAQDDITASKDKFNRQTESDSLLSLPSDAGDDWRANNMASSLHRQSKSNEQNGRSFQIIWRGLTRKVNNTGLLARAKQNYFDRNNSGDNTKVILNSIDGSIQSGQLTAIMGPSGSGKSSLLNCLFRNLTHGVTGRIQVQGSVPHKLKLCFIPQQDYLIEYLTVLEDLMFVSKLRNVGRNTNQTNNEEKNAGDVDHRANAISAARDFGLTHRLDVKISRLSGGELKRLSIAREVMSNPDVLILDEPTTGLDSLSCIRIIRVLRNLIESSCKLRGLPMAIVIVIHQPQLELFEMFDKAYFLSRKGTVIYEDKPQKAVETIENSARLSLPCANYNPASFLIQIGSDPMYDSSLELLVDNQKTKYKENNSLPPEDKLSSSVKEQSKIGNSSMSTLAQMKDGTAEVRISLDNSSALQSDTSESTNSLQNDNESNTNNSANTVTKSSQLQNSSDRKSYYISRELQRASVPSHPKGIKLTLRYIIILTHRSWLALIRNPTFSRSRFVFHVVIALIMAAVFGSEMGVPTSCPIVDSELDLNTVRDKVANKLVSQMQESARLCLENLGFYFIMMFSFTVIGVTITASKFPFTMRLIKKEFINGLYSSAPYLIAQTLAELPMEIFYPSLTVLIAYPLTGQTSSFMEWRMFTACLMVVLATYVMYNLGVMCGALLPNSPNTAVTIGQTLLLPPLLLSGFLVRPKRMPFWLNKFTWVSPYKLGIDGVIVARYGFNVCPCDEKSIVNGSLSIVGLNPQIRNVFNYYIQNSELPDNTTAKIDVDFFDKLGKRLTEAQTYGLTIESCDDVKPYPMHMYSINDNDLFFGIFGLIVMILVIKILTFLIIRSYLGRGTIK